MPTSGGSFGGDQTMDLVVITAEGAVEHERHHISDVVDQFIATCRDENIVSAIPSLCLQPVHRLKHRR